MPCEELMIILILLNFVDGVLEGTLDVVAAVVSV